MIQAAPFPQADMLVSPPCVYSLQTIGPIWSSYGGNFGLSEAIWIYLQAQGIWKWQGEKTNRITVISLELRPHIDLFVIRMSSQCSVQKQINAHVIIRIFYDIYDDDDEDDDDERYSDKQTC